MPGRAATATLLEEGMAPQDEAAAAADSYGFSPPRTSAPRRWSSSHSLPAPASPPHGRPSSRLAPRPQAYRSLRGILTKPQPDDSLPRRGASTRGDYQDVPRTPRDYQEGTRWPSRTYQDAPRGSRDYHYDHTGTRDYQKSARGTRDYPAGSTREYQDSPRANKEYPDTTREPVEYPAPSRDGFSPTKPARSYQDLPRTPSDYHNTSRTSTRGYQDTSTSSRATKDLEGIPRASSRDYKNLPRPRSIRNYQAGATFADPPREYQDRPRSSSRVYQDRGNTTKSYQDSSRISARDYQDSTRGTRDHHTTRTNGDYQDLARGTRDLNSPRSIPRDYQDMTRSTTRDCQDSTRSTRSYQDPARPTRSYQDAAPLPRDQHGSARGTKGYQSIPRITRDYPDTPTKITKDYPDSTRGRGSGARDTLGSSRSLRDHQASARSARLSKDYIEPSDSLQTPTLTLKEDTLKEVKEEEDEEDNRIISHWGEGGAGGHYDQHHRKGSPSPNDIRTLPLPLPRTPVTPQHYSAQDVPAAPTSPTPSSHPPQQPTSPPLHNHNHNHHQSTSYHHIHSYQLSNGSRQALVRTHATQGHKCRDCLSRVPYATLIATVMCCVGVGVFCTTVHSGTTLTVRLLEEVFNLHITWMEPMQLSFLVVGASMGGLGLLILIVACLSTGTTLNRVYNTWRARLGGKITCALLMGLAYLLTLAWLLLFAGLIIVTIFYTLAWFQCINVPNTECIDYNQFRFLFPRTTIEEEKRVCSGGKRKLFCKDFVNNGEIMFLLATASAFLVILSLVHYLMCLAANYAHIKDHGKLMELQEIQFLHESEMSTLAKDRF